MTVSGSPAKQLQPNLAIKISAGVSFARDERQQQRLFSLRGVGPWAESLTWRFVRNNITRNAARLEVERAFDQAVRKRAGDLTDEVPHAKDLLNAIAPYRAECLNHVRTIIEDAFSKDGMFSKNRIEKIRNFGPFTPAEARAVPLLQTILDVLEQIPNQRAFELAVKLAAKLEPVKDIFEAESARANELAANKRADLLKTADPWADF